MDGRPKKLVDEPSKNMLHFDDWTESLRAMHTWQQCFDLFVTLWYHSGTEIGAFQPTNTSIVCTLRLMAKETCG